MTEPTTPAPDDAAAEPPAAPGTSARPEPITAPGASAGAGPAGWAPPVGAPVATLPPGRPPLRRSREDRVIAGVAGGIGRWLGIDPVLVRVVLVVLAVFGGSGLLLYLIGWLLIPDEGATTTEANRLLADARRPGSPGRTTLVVLAVVLLLVVLGSNTGGPWRGMWGFFGGGSVLLLVLVGALAFWLLRKDERPYGTDPGRSAAPLGGWPAPGGTAAGDAATAAGATLAATPGPATGQPPAGATGGGTVPAPGYAGTVYPGSPYDSASPYAGTAPTEPYTGTYVGGTYPTATDPAYATGYAYGGYGAYPTYPQPAAAPAVPRPPRERSYLGLLTLSVAIVVVGVLGVLNANGAGIPAVVVLSAGLGILGLGLLVGAFAGRARWLVALALPLLLVTQAVSVLPANLHLGNGVGDRTWTPTSVPAAADGTRNLTYRLDLGTGRLDLTGLTLPAGTTTVTASVGTGELRVTVPSDVRVHVVGAVSLGEIKVEGQPKQDGADNHVDVVLPAGSGTSATTAPADATTTLELDLQVGVGTLEVSRA